MKKTLQVKLSAPISGMEQKETVGQGSVMGIEVRTQQVVSTGTSHTNSIWLILCRNAEDPVKDV